VVVLLDCDRVLVYGGILIFGNGGVLVVDGVPWVWLAKERMEGMAML
jgi:hypothetical protein